MRSALFLAAGILLLATAAFHMTGYFAVASWMDGMQGRTISALWVAPALSWFAIAVFWIFHAFSAQAPGWSSVLVTAAIPLSVAIPLLAVVAPLHPGGYMLTGSSALALLAKKRLS